MRGAERVVFALGALGEAGEAAALAQRADAVAAAGQDLVRIGLVADVPDQAVARRVEDVMERDGELDHAEPGAEMAAGHRDGVDGLLAQLVGELAQLPAFEPAQVRRVLIWSSSGVLEVWDTLTPLPFRPVTLRAAANLTRSNPEGQIENAEGLTASRFAFLPRSGTRRSPGRFSRVGARWMSCVMAPRARIGRAT